MDTKGDLLRNGWITLVTAFAFVALLALAGRASAADVEHTVAYGSIDPISYHKNLCS